MNIPIPENENERLKALYEYNLLDTLPEENFDRLTKLASIICEVPIALISIIDKERQWFKSNVGLGATQTPRNISFCQYSIMGTELFEVEDALKDSRFKENPLVLEDPNIRFYAGYPIIDLNGFALGTLCVIDKTPKTLSENQRLALKTLAEDIMIQIAGNKKNEERRKLERLFYMSQDMICIAGVDGYLKKINTAFTKILGWTESELLEKQFFDFIHPDDIEKTNLEVINLSKGISTINFTNRYRTKSNEYKLLQWFAHSDIETSEIFAIGRDITQLTLNESALRDSKQQNLALLKGIPDLIFRMNKDGIFLDFKANEKDTIIPPESIIGTNLLNVPFPEKMKNEIFEKHYSAITTNELQQCEYEISINNIKHFYEARIVKSGENETISICRDITKEKESEKEFIKAIQIAESANSAKSNFLSNMSHEIRTPMNAIIGFSSFLKETELNKIQSEYVSNINVASENLLEIINDILDISKIEAGMMQIENAVFDFNALLKNIYSLMKDKCLKKNLAFSINTDQLIPQYLVGDSTRLSQVIINLVANAIKFTSKGFVNIRVDLVKSDLNKVLLKFEVSDSGIGIAPGNLKSIFDRFKQESSDTSRNYGGTGLGLSIVKDLITMMNGEINIDSEPGKGSEFKVAIPFEKCSKKQIKEFQKKLKETESIKSNEIGKLHVLLVEDNKMNQRYCSILLSEFGYTCTIANSGIEAIQKLKEEKFDLIIMDLQMPEMDGYETSIILRVELKIETPIIALTANALPEEKLKCLKCGMNDYLAKPFKPNQLNKKIIALFKSSSIKNKNPLKKESQKNIIDAAFLNEQVHGNKAAVKELINIFLDDTPSDINLLETAINNSDFNSIEKITHKLVSSYSILGATNAINIFKKIESQSGKKISIKELKILFEQIKKINSSIETEINKMELV